MKVVSKAPKSDSSAEKFSKKNGIAKRNKKEGGFNVQSIKPQAAASPKGKMKVAAIAPSGQSKTVAMSSVSPKKNKKSKAKHSPLVSNPLQKPSSNSPAKKPRNKNKPKKNVMESSISQPSSVKQPVNSSNVKPLQEPILSKQKKTNFNNKQPAEESIKKTDGPAAVSGKKLIKKKEHVTNSNKTAVLQPSVLKETINSLNGDKFSKKKRTKDNLRQPAKKSFNNSDTSPMSGKKLKNKKKHEQLSQEKSSTAPSTVKKAFNSPTAVKFQGKSSVIGQELGKGALSRASSSPKQKGKKQKKNSLFPEQPLNQNGSGLAEVATEPKAVPTLSKKNAKKAKKAKVDKAVNAPQNKSQLAAEQVKTSSILTPEPAKPSLRPNKKKERKLSQAATPVPLRNEDSIITNKKEKVTDSAMKLQDKPLTLTSVSKKQNKRKRKNISKGTPGVESSSLPVVPVIKNKGVPLSVSKLTSKAQDVSSNQHNLSPSVLGKRKRKHSVTPAVTASPGEDSDANNDTNEHPASKKQKKELLPEVLKKTSSAVLKLVKESQDSSVDLFSESTPISMHVVVFKVPQTPYRQIRCALPHSILPPNPEVCLIVPDMERGRKTDEELDRMTQAYTDLLQEQGVSSIKEVIPFGKLRAEYGAFEMKRRLAKTFDIFLCDGRIQGHAINFLGKMFEKVKKIPIPIKAVETVGAEKTVFVPNIKNAIESALQKVYFTLHDHGTSFAVPVGHSMLNEKQLSENIETLWDKINDALPGRIANIRSVYLKGPNTVGIPLYVSLEPLKLAPSAHNQKMKPVKGELSTNLGRKVLVFPSGKVKVLGAPTEDEMAFAKRVDGVREKKTRQKRKHQDVSDASSDEDDDDSQDFKQDVVKVSKVDEVLENGDNSDNDEDVDIAENAYLSELR